MPYQKPICQETMGLIEFLRRVQRREPLPDSIRVRGLDTVLEEAQDTTETARVMRNLLAMRNEYMARQNVLVVFPNWTFFAFLFPARDLHSTLRVIKRRDTS